MRSTASFIELYSECDKGVKEMTIEEKAKVYLYNITNAYRQPEDRVSPGVVIDLKSCADWTEELAAMMIAMISMTDQLKGGLEEHYSDLVGFTHLLNRVAIQFSDFDDD